MASIVAAVGGPFNSESGLATAVYLSDPVGLALGADGSLYIGDVANRRVRRVAPNGYLATIAGTGTTAFSGDGGPPAAAGIGVPEGVAVGPDESVYVTDAANRRVRRIRPVFLALPAALSPSLEQWGRSVRL